MIKDYKSLIQKISTQIHNVSLNMAFQLSLSSKTLEIEAISQHESSQLNKFKEKNNTIKIGRKIKFLFAFRIFKISEFGSLLEIKYQSFYGP